MITARTPDEANALYESARKVDGPWSSGKKLTIVQREPFHLLDEKGKRYLDLHGQILCDSLGTVNVIQEVREQLRHTDISTMGPDFTHPIIDQAQASIAGALEKEGWGEYQVMFDSSGTRANENALRLGRAVLGGRMHLAMLREGYHGAGLMSATCGHSSWKAQSTLPLGVPTSFLEFEEGGGGRDFLESFARMQKTDAASDAMPYLMAEGGVQGVAGFQVIDPTSLREMATRTHKSGGAVHYDLVQTMPWRTGDGLFCIEGLVDPKDPDTIPDLVSGAKGNGGGMPFAFLAVRKEFLKRAEKTSFGKGYDTYGRTLEGAAAFNTVFNTVNTPAFQQNAKERSAQLQEGLETLLDTHSTMINGITGKGLMQGIELESAEQVVTFKRVGMEETGLVIAAGGHKGNILRVGVRLDSTEEVIAEALRKIKDTIEKIQSRD